MIKITDWYNICIDYIEFITRDQQKHLQYKRDLKLVTFLIVGQILTCMNACMLHEVRNGMEEDEEMA